MYIQSRILIDLISPQTLNRTRDSALRAIVLSCRKNFHFYFPTLLQNVTIDATNLISIQSLFQRENHGHLVRSLHIKHFPSENSEKEPSLVWNDIAAISGLASSVDHRIRLQQGLTMLSIRMFRNVPSIETLILGDSTHIRGLFFERHTFLTNSLKKLYIGSDKASRNNLSSRNGLWLLLFVPSLQSAALWIDFSIIDFQFLLEFGDTIEGLSRVSKLSLGILFIWNDAKPKTWWGSQEEHYQHSAQGNQKTFAVSQLLRCVNTNTLVSLEIVGNFEDPREGDETFLSADCLTVLHQSFNSLLHLRLFGLSFRLDRPNSRCFSNFKIMKILTLNDGVLHDLQICGQGFAFPSSLEVVCLPYYSDRQSRTEKHLLQFIKLRSSSLPRLREVVVPKSSVLFDKTAGNLEDWTLWRERLEKEEIFTSGKVILRKAEGGEIGE